MTQYSIECWDNPDLSNLVACDHHEFRDWHSRIGEIQPFARAILKSEAFSRLGAITFLGILSPRFADTVQSPLYAKRSRPLPGDGSRQSHSLGVAIVALDMARFLGFSETAQRYAVAWGLLHDIGNWPLSHTGEAAFSRLTGASTRELRKRIIVGDPSFPSSLRLERAIREDELAPELLVAFLNRQADELSLELRQLLEVLTSPLSPDTLEGMWRAGKVFEVAVPPPSQFTRLFLHGLFRDVYLNKQFSDRVLTFWRLRRSIYQRFINEPSVMDWESKWSRAIQRRFAGISLLDSLYLRETDIVSNVLAQDSLETGPLSRYKDPLEYVIEPQNRRSFSTDLSLAQLAKVLTQRQLTLSGAPKR